jgi:hypothetical protein
MIHARGARCIAPLRASDFYWKCSAIRSAGLNARWFGCPKIFGIFFSFHRTHYAFGLRTLSVTDCPVWSSKNAVELDGNRFVWRRFWQGKWWKKPKKEGEIVDKNYSYRPVLLPVFPAAAQNLEPEFFTILAKLGLNVVIVCFRADLQSPIWKYDRLKKTLDDELKGAKAGQYDSTYYAKGAIYHFFHATNLGKAMTQLKASLETRGLLEITKILHAETPQELRVWYPPTAELIE